MAIREIKQRNSYFYGLEHSETISDGQNGDTIFIPALSSRKTIACRLIAGANTGKIQTSTSLDSDVLAGNAIWEDWSAGDTTGTYTDVILANVSAIRGVSITGEIKIEIKI